LQSLVVQIFVREIANTHSERDTVTGIGMGTGSGTVGIISPFTDRET
jgi:hypothetical protein